MRFSSRICSKETNTPTLLLINHPDLVPDTSNIFWYWMEKRVCGKEIHYTNHPDMQKWYTNKCTLCKNPPTYAREAKDINTNKHAHKPTRTHTLTLTAGSRCHFPTNTELINIHKYRSLSTGTQPGERRRCYSRYCSTFLFSHFFLCEYRMLLQLVIEKKSSNPHDVIVLVRFTFTLARIQDVHISWCVSLAVMHALGNVCWSDGVQ